MVTSSFKENEMGRYADVAKKAAELTNKQLANEISSISNLRDRDIDKLIKLKEDRKRFIELMSKVESETSETEKEAYVIDNVANLAPVIVKALKYFV
ncbi:MAG TPA: hypothetical protein DG048_17705 [Pseudoalteromonas sp.]|nr:hypothetical protein [Pseudoalteromonas sp.]|tara:strand:- start:1258 stop:1548 length:291 start_codon:yes stop_codon:yes gene_type:complete